MVCVPPLSYRDAAMDFRDKIFYNSLFENDLR